MPTVFPILLVILLAYPLFCFAGEPINLQESALNGEYIGKHIAVLNHQEVIDSIINDLNIDADFREKVRTGDLISDDRIKVDIEWTSTGYRARFNRLDRKSAEQVFEVGVKDLQRPAVSSKFIQSDQRILNLPPRKRPYWLRFRVLNDSERPAAFLLELDKHLYNYINVYMPQKDGFHIKRATFDKPLNQRAIRYKHFVFQLAAEPGESTLYLYVSSWAKGTTDSVPLRIWSRENFIHHASDDGLYYGIFVGLFLFIFLYNLFLFISVREPSYAFLSMVTLFQLLVEMTTSGLGFQYVWPNSPYLSLQILSQGIALVMGFNLLFCRSFVGIGRYTPRLDRGLLYMSWFFFILAFVAFFLPLFKSGLVLIFLIIMDHLYCLPIILPAVIAIRHKNRSGLFLLIGIFFYYLGLLKFNLRGSDTISYDMFKYLPVKGLSFLIIMTLGLSDKFNSMRRSLIDLNINLERRIIERTEKLQKANEKLKELDTLKNRLFANISHEFRTPLTLILEPIRSLQRGEYGRLPRRSQEVLSSIKRNADRLLKLISDYLDLSKIEAGRMNLNQIKHNMSELLSVCVSSFDSSATSMGLAIEFEDKTGGLECMIDPDLMEKAVYNLLSNAIKFNRPEGSNRISVVLEKDSEYFRIIVKDSGTGIPEDKLETIFERFRQVDPSSTRRHEGTGIGLSLTLEIVELHDGEIYVDSRIGEGSTFTISIPLAGDFDQPAVEGRHEVALSGEPEEGVTGDAPVADMDAKPRKPLKLTRDISSADMTILVVEDNEDMRLYLSGILNRHYQTLAAADGREALKKLEQYKVDLVLSDLMMPGMDGYELTRTIRSRANFQSLPIILLTARSDIPDRIQGFEQGANDYIIKPFSTEEVLSRIKSHLNFKLLRDKLVTANLNLKGKRKILSDASMIRIEAVKVFLNDNYAEEISRDDLADMARMSPDHLGKMFKQYTGMKISDFVNQKRVEEASRQLRETRAKVVDIAFDVGFGTLRSFNQVFRDITGSSPSEYRKKAGNSS